MCGVLDRTDFKQLYIGRALKELICKVSTLGVCGDLDTTDLQQFLLWEGVVALKELSFNNC